LTKNYDDRRVTWLQAIAKDACVEAPILQGGGFLMLRSDGYFGAARRVSCRQGRQTAWRKIVRSLLTNGAIVGSTCSFAHAQDFGAPPPAPAAAPPAVSFASPTPGAYPLTLEEAKQLAISNNTKVQLGRLNVEQKRLAIRAAQTDYLPKILGSYAAVHFSDGLGTVLTTPGIALPVHEVAVNVINQNSSYGSIIAAQPITQLIGVSALVDIARAEANAAAAQLDAGQGELVSGVTQAYTGLVVARKIQAALNLQVEMVTPLLKQHPTAELRLGLLQVRKGLAEINSQIAELTDTLNQLLCLPPGTELVVTEPTLPQVPVNSADEAAQFAMTNNPKICEAQQDILKAHAGIKAAKMDCLPTVDVLGGYVNQNIADYIQPNIGFVGVTANYTLLDWGKRNCVLHQREKQLMMANKNVQATAETVQLDARKAYLAFTQAQGELQIAKEIVGASEEGVKEAQGPVAVLTANAAVAKAQLDEMKAELNLRLAQIKLLAAVGQQ
jgi:outer membrane protein TolC